MKKHHALYQTLLDGMARYGGTLEGAAEEGLGVLIRIVPALVGLLTAVYMLRAS